MSDPDEYDEYADDDFDDDDVIVSDNHKDTTQAKYNDLLPNVNNCDPNDENGQNGDASKAAPVEHGRVENDDLPGQDDDEHGTGLGTTIVGPKTAEDEAVSDQHVDSAEKSPVASDDHTPRLVSTDDDLKRRLWEASESLVREGEKNVKLALQVEKSKGELHRMEQDISRFRRLLLQGINGGISDVENYANISLGELLRIRLQEPDGTITAQELDSDGESFNQIQQLERKLVSEQNRNDALRAKCLALKEELQSSSLGTQEVNKLKGKIAQMVDRSRHERELRSRAEKEVLLGNERVVALSDHIEKLMVHLKHEAISKARALAEQSRTQREVERLTTRNQTMAKRNARKDRAINELKEGGKILEDQLRLMDEKYMELRLKLDWTRTQTERTIKKKDEEARQLRAKLTLVTEIMPGRDKKGQLEPLLDDYDFGAKGMTKKSQKTPSVKSSPVKPRQNIPS